jgi:hypothetical protein
MPGFAGFLQSVRPEPGEGPGALERALAAPDTPDPEPSDPDEVAANLLARHYEPGMASDLAQRLGDVMGELQAEREKVERDARRQEQVMRAHRNGQLSAWDIPAALGDDLGDRGRVGQLERRAESLRRQIAEASELIRPPQQRAPDPLEAVTSRAHAAFAEATRAKLAEAQGQPRQQRASRPFPSRGGVAVRSEPVTCDACIAVGASPEESFLIHHMDADGQLLSVSPDAPVSVPPDNTGRSEAARLRALGYSAETAQYAATPAGAGTAVR